MFCTVCLKSSCLLICFHSWSLDLSQTLIQTIQILKEETTAPKPMEKQKTNKKNHPMSPVQLPLRPSPWVETLFFFCFFPPQLCVGFLFLILYPGAPRLLLLPPLLPHTTLSIFHTQLCRSHTQLCHTPTFTHNFVTHYLSHTTLSHTIFHTQLSHTPSFRHLSHTPTLSHTSTFISRGRRGTNSHPPWFCVAGVALMALGDIHIHFTWQAWHKLASTVVLRGRRATYGIPSFCVAGVALM